MLINGHRVKEIRKDAVPKKTSAELAVAAGMSAAWVAKLEGSDSHEVNEHIARAMARFLGVKLEDLK